VNKPRKPGFTLVSNGLEHTFTDTTQGIESRIWNLGDNTFDTAKVVTHSYATSGNFLVRLYTMDLNGCSDSSNQTVLSTTGISSLSVSNGISVYPNPTNNRLFVISEYPLEQAEVWNNLGLQLYQGLFNSTSIEIDVRAYPAGVYYLKVCTVKGEHNRIKFIIK
jgi:hypothetical protein